MPRCTMCGKILDVQSDEAEEYCDACVQMLADEQEQLDEGDFWEEVMQEQMLEHQ